MYKLWNFWCLITLPFVWLEKAREYFLLGFLFILLLAFIF